MLIIAIEVRMISVRRMWVGNSGIVGVGLIECVSVGVGEDAEG